MSFIKFKYLLTVHLKLILPKTISKLPQKCTAFGRNRFEISFWLAALPGKLNSSLQRNNGFQLEYLPSFKKSKIM